MLALDGEHTGFDTALEWKSRKPRKRPRLYSMFETLGGRELSGMAEAHHIM